MALPESDSARVRLRRARMWSEPAFPCPSADRKKGSFEHSSIFGSARHAYEHREENSSRLRSHRGHCATLSKNNKRRQSQP